MPNGVVKLLKSKEPQAAKQEAVEVYKTFSELDLEIVVDVRSFTVAALAEPEEIIIPETHSSSSNTDEQKPVLVAPAPHTRQRGVKSYRDKTKITKVVAGEKPSISISNIEKNTILKTSLSKTSNRASRNAPDRVSRKKATPRQDNIFKRFTALLIDFIKDKFILAKTGKTKVDIISEEHDKRIAENYVFDEVLGHYTSRPGYEKQAKFNHDDYKPTPDEINRFPSRLKNEQPHIDNSMDFGTSVKTELSKAYTLRLKPASIHGRNK